MHGRLEFVCSSELYPTRVVPQDFRYRLKKLGVLERLGNVINRAQLH